MLSVTCLTCSVAFQDVSVGRDHYKTDWHRYNLKRKVAGLSPVTLEKFEEREKQVRDKQGQGQETAQESSYCSSCNKAFSTLNAYENHIQSKKHKEVVAGAPTRHKRSLRPKDKSAPGTLQLAEHQESQVQSPAAVDEDKATPEDDSDVESWSSSDENGLGLEQCLFCPHVSSSMSDNLSHMTSHGLFLPDAEYICDLEGLVTYLGEKVGIGHVCLWCNQKGKQFHNTKDVQRHMLDKGHCKIFYEGDFMLEYSDFYDYTSSYPDSQQQQLDPDELVAPEELDGDGFSLTLPSGAVIGHRSLAKYYRQNLVPYLHERTKLVLPKMLLHYKALGWTGSSGSQVQQRAKDLQFMQRMRHRHYTKLGCQGNNLRHRFRDPNGLI